MKNSVSPAKRFRAIFLAILLSCGFVTVVSSPAAASSPPVVLTAPASTPSKMIAPALVAANAWPWPHNGCTYAPDNIYGYSVLDACNRHDGCYVMHWSSRETCDAWFLSDLQKVCRRMPYYMSGGCFGITYIYYGAVRAIGGSFYNGNTYQIRMNTRMS